MNAVQTDAATIDNGKAAAVNSTSRLVPIEEPDSWWMWFAHKTAEWTEGTVITPMRGTARFPESLRHVLADRCVLV